ncbi:MAG: hypothetical protein QNJ98_17315 [Planctomycetota bacterium]|nr:hypothetical protein [Planctomycetota bacterium]
MTSRWPLLIPIFALVVIGILAMAQPPHLPPEDRTPPEEADELPTTRPEPPERTQHALPPARYTDADLPGYVGDVLDGGTRFQRRVASAAALRRLTADVRARRVSPRSAAASVNRLVALRLQAEHRRPWPPPFDPEQPVPGRTKVLDILEVLRAGPFEPERLRARKSADDKAAMRDAPNVRVWAPLRSRLAKSAIRSGAALLHRLDQRVGVTSDDGFDVLHAPDCGRAIFPRLRIRRIWVGVFLFADDFGIVDSDLAPGHWEITLRHELVHAWQHMHLADWHNRFICEGLATYLSRLESGDDGFEVPVERLRNNFKLLLEMVDRLGKNGRGMNAFRLERLIHADPWEFYELGYFSYLVAQACMAYLDAKVIGHALWSGQEDDLRLPLARIGWTELLAWVRSQAAGGTAGNAFVVGDDGDPMDPAEDAADRPRFPHRVLERMGVVISPSGARDALRLGDDALIDNDAHVGRVMAEIFARDGKGPVTLACDVSPAMDEARGPMVRPPEEARLRFNVPRREGTPRAFMKRFLALAAYRFRERDLNLLAVSDRVEATRRPLPVSDEPLNRAAVPWYLRFSEPRAGPLVLFFASEAEPGVEEETRVTDLVHAVQPLPEGLGPYLVVDLGKQPGYGRDLAKAIYRAGRAKGVRVAYWHAAEEE